MSVVLWLSGSRTFASNQISSTIAEPSGYTLKGMLPKSESLTVKSIFNLPPELMLYQSLICWSFWSMLGHGIGPAEALMTTVDLITMGKVGIGVGIGAGSTCGLNQPIRFL